MKRYCKNIVAFALSVAIISCSTAALVEAIGTMAGPDPAPDMYIQPDTLSVGNPVPECIELRYDHTTITETIGEAKQEPQQLDWHDAISDEEAKMLVQTIYNEAQVLYWTGDRYGMSYPARQAAVAWCALNRLDSGAFGDSLAEVLTAPFQFAYTADAPVTEHMLWLVDDVLNRWWAEKNGCNNVGRTLPQEYIYFSGYDGENYFRDEYHADTVWDWSLPDPYAEEWQ